MALGAMQGILGIRPDYDGLIISPAIPKTWKSFEVTKIYRNIKYKITVLNPSAKRSGIRKNFVNGIESKSNKIHFNPSDTGTTVIVKAIM